MPPINPIRLLFGPIFQTEMRILGRHTSTYVLRFAFALVVTAFFSLVLVSTWSNARFSASGTVADLQRFQQIAPTISSTVLWTQYVGLILIAPILTGSSICGERLGRTMAALLTTPLKAPEILLSKLAGRMTHVLILAGISLPMLFAARMLGGMNIEGILAAAALTFVSVLLAASLTLNASISAKRPTRASSAGFGAFLCVSFFPFIFGSLYNFWLLPKLPASGLPQIPVQWGLVSSMPISLGFVSMEHFAGSPTGMSSMQLWGWSAIWGLAVSAVVLMIAALRLRRTMQRDPEADFSKIATKRKRKSRGKNTTVPQDDVPDVAATGASRRSRDVGDQPVLWREVRQPIFKKLSHRILAMIGITVGIVLLLINDAFNEQGTYFVFTFLCTAAVVFQACYAGTGAIAHERETRTLDVLLTTPLSPRSIIFAKWFGAIRKLALIPSILLTLLIIGVLLDLHPIAIPLIFLAVIPPVFLFTASGVLLSVYMKTVPAAMTNVAMAVGLYVLAPLLLAMSSEIFRLNSLGSFEYLTTAYFSLHPAIMGVITIDGCYDRGYGRGLLEFSMPEQTISAIPFMTLLLTSAAIQLGGAFGLLTLAARALPVRSGRPS